MMDCGCGCGCITITRILLLVVFFVALAGNIFLSDYFLNSLVPHFTMNDIDLHKCHRDGSSITTNTINPLLVPRIQQHQEEEQKGVVNEQPNNRKGDVAVEAAIEILENMVLRSLQM